MDELREKFKTKQKWEWQMFQSDMMSMSRENLFCLAEMIAVKKRIFRLLQEEDSFSRQEICRMLSQERMVDFIYMQLPEEKGCCQLEEIKQALR